MSNTIDDKVVGLGLDNRNFEANAKTSISTVEKLKKALSFKGFKGFEKFDEAIDKSTDQVKIWASMVQGALWSVGESALNFGKNFVKSVSIDQLTAGWDKFENKTTAIQTIMAATKTTWEEEAKAIGFAGSQMEYVESVMEKLMWFSDETSYSLTDMTTNIGKFVSAGIDLQTATTAIEGIGTWASLSGKDAATGARIMGQMAQALGSGYIQTQDWASVETANMDTVEFKKLALETAAAMGTLRKEGDKYITTNEAVKEGVEVTAETFRRTLTGAQGGWFSSDIFVETSRRFALVADYLYKVMDEFDSIDSTTVLLSRIEDIQEGTVTLEAAADDLGLEMTDLQKIMDDLGTSEMQFALRAFRASQETKTLSEAVGATKEAVASGWSRSFELLIGNYDEARAFYGDLVEKMYTLFVEGGNARNDILSKWRELDVIPDNATAKIDEFEKRIVELQDLISKADSSGEKSFLEKTLANTEKELDNLKRSINGTRQNLLDSILSIVDVVQNIKDAVSETVKEVFGAIDEKTIFRIVSDISNFVNDAVEGSGEFIEWLSNRLKTFLNIIDIGKDFISSFSTPLEYLANTTFGFVTEKISPIIDAFSSLVELFREQEKEFNFFGKITKKLTNLIKSLGSSFDSLIERLTGSTIGEWFEKLRGYLSEGLDGEFSFIPWFEELVDMIPESVEEIGESLQKAFSKLTSLIKNKVEKLKDFILSIFKNLFNGGGGLVSSILSGLSEALGSLWAGAVGIVGQLSAGVPELLGNVFDFILSENTVNNVSSMGDSVMNVVKNLASVLSDVSDSIVPIVAVITDAIDGLMTAIGNADGSKYSGFITAAIDFVGNILKLVSDKLNSIDYNSLSSTLESLKTTLSPLIESLKGFFEEVISLATEIVDLGKDVLSNLPVENVKNFIVSVMNFIGEILDVATGFIQNAAPGDLDKVMSYITDSISALAPIKDNSSSVAETLTAVADVADSVGDCSEKLSTVASSSIGDKFHETISSILDFVQALIDFLTGFLRMLTESGLDITLSDILSILHTSKLAEVAVSVEKASGSLKSMADAIKGISFLNGLSIPIEAGKKMLDSVKGFFDEAKKKLGGVGKEKTSTMVLKIAFALVLICSAFKGLAEFTPEELGSATATIGVLGILLESISQLETRMNKGKILKEGETLAGEGKGQIIAVAAAIYAIAKAFEMLAEIPEEKMGQAIVMFGELALALGGLEASTKLLKSGISKDLIAIAASIFLLAWAMKMFANDFDEGTFETGIGRLIVVLGVLGGFMKFISGFQLAIEGSALGIIAIAASVLILSYAMKMLNEALSGSSISETVTSFAALGIIMALLAGLLNFLDPTKLAGLSAASLGIIAIAAAVVIISYGFKMLLEAVQGVPAEDVVKAIGSLIVICLALMGVLAVISTLDVKSATAAAIAMVAVAGAMVIMVVAMAGLVLLNTIGDLTMPIIAFVAIMGSLVAFCAVVSKNGVSILAASAAMLVLAVALAAMVAIIVVLGALPTDLVVDGLVKFAAVLGVLAAAVLVFAVAAKIAGPSFSELGVGLIALSAGMVLFAVALALIVSSIAIILQLLGYGVNAGVVEIAVGSCLDNVSTAFGDFLEGAKEWLSNLIDGISGFIKGIKDTFMNFLHGAGEFFSGIIDGIKGFGKSVADWAVGFIDSVKQVPGKIATAVSTGWHKFLNSVSDSMTKLGASLKEHAQKAVASIVDGFHSKLESVKTFISEFKDKVVNWIKSFFGLNKKSEESETGKLGGEMMTSVRDGFKSNFKLFDGENGVISQLLDSIGNGIKNGVGKLKSIGKNLIDGIIGGVTGETPELEDSLVATEQAGEDAVKRAAMIRSPSKAFAKLGSYMALGLAKGVDDSSSETVDSMTSLSNRMLAAIDSEFNANPVITPILDLSEIQNGNSLISGLLGSISGSVSLAGTNSNLVNAKLASSNNLGAMSGSATTNNTSNYSNAFYITGSNPKEIANEVSRILQLQVERKSTAWA